MGITGYGGSRGEVESATICRESELEPLETVSGYQGGEVDTRTKYVFTKYWYDSRHYVEKSRGLEPEIETGMIYKSFYAYTIVEGLSQIGKNGEQWKLYNERWLKGIDLSRKYLFWTEGEKDADTVSQKLGMMAVSAQSKGRNEIEAGLLRLKECGLEGIAILPDHDDSGYKQAENVKQIAVALGLKVAVIPMTELVENPPNKSDISDIVESLPESKQKKLIRLQMRLIATSKFEAAKTKTSDDMPSQIQVDIQQDYKLVANKLKSELALYLSEECKITQKVIKSQIKKSYGLTDKDFEELTANNLESKKESSQKPKLKKVNELASDAPDETDWLIPNLLAVGEFKYLISLLK